MIKNELKKLFLFGLLVSSSISIVAAEPTTDQSETEKVIIEAKCLAIKGAQEFARGPLGYASHTGVAYLALSYNQNKYAVTAILGATAFYHSKMYIQRRSFLWDAQDMMRDNTASNNPIIRNVWYNQKNACDLLQEYNQSDNTKKINIREQLLRELGCARDYDQASVLLNTAFVTMKSKLYKYQQNSNIFDYISKELIHSVDHDLLLNGNVLLTSHLNRSLEKVLEHYASNGWIANSLTADWCRRERSIIEWGISPYDATYNSASLCIAEVVKQYARLRVIKHIIEQGH